MDAHPSTMMSEECFNTYHQYLPDEVYADAKLNRTDSDQSDAKLSKNACKHRNKRARKAHVWVNHDDEGFGYGEPTRRSEVNGAHEVDSPLRSGVKKNDVSRMGEEVEKAIALISREETLSEASLLRSMELEELACVSSTAHEISEATGGNEQAGWTAITAKPRKLRKKTGNDGVGSHESNVLPSASPPASVEVARPQEGPKIADDSPIEITSHNAGIEGESLYRLQTLVLSWRWPMKESRLPPTSAPLVIPIQLAPSHVLRPHYLLGRSYNLSNLWEPLRVARNGRD